MFFSLVYTNLKTKPMKNLFLPLLIVTTLFGCSSDETETTPMTGNPTGEYFMEFKIDGQHYRMDENLLQLTITTAANGQASGSYYLAPGISNASDDSFMLFTIYDDAPITQMHYDFAPYTGAPGTVFNPGTFAFNRSDGRQYQMGSTTTGAVDFTRLEIQPNGVLEGTFHFTNLRLIDEDGDQISTDHQLTDGRFRIAVRQ